MCLWELLGPDPDTPGVRDEVVDLLGFERLVAGHFLLRWQECGKDELPLESHSLLTPILFSVLSTGASVNVLLPSLSSSLHIMSVIHSCFYSCVAAQARFTCFVRVLSGGQFDTFSVFYNVDDPFGELDSESASSCLAHLLKCSQSRWKGFTGLSISLLSYLAVSRFSLLSYLLCHLSRSLLRPFSLVSSDDRK